MKDQDDTLCGYLWLIPAPVYLAEDSPYRSETYSFIRYEYLSVNNGPYGWYAVVVEFVKRSITYSISASVGHVEVTEITKTEEDLWNTPQTNIQESNGPD